MFILSRYFMPRKTTSIIRHFSNMANNSLYAENDFDGFKKSLSRIMDHVLSENSCLAKKEVTEYIKKLTEYTVLGGRKTSPLVVLQMYEKCEQPDRITKESVYKSHVLAWCTEIYNSAFLILDDMLNGVKTRRDKTCWYLLPGLNPRAANDAIILRSLLYEILRQNFNNEPYYDEILNQFNESYLYHHLSQHLEFSTDFKTIDKNDVNIENYNFMAEIKATHVFKVPLILAMLLSNKYKPEMSGPITKVCRDIGKLYQIQNEYLDFYRDVEITDKSGIKADILGGKFTWPAVTAFQHCDAEQRASFIKYYDSAEPEHVKLIKQLYDDLQLPEIYKKTEKLLVDSIVQECNSFPKEIPSEPILNVLNYITEADCLGSHKNTE